MKAQKLYDMTKRKAAYTALLFILGAFVTGWLTSVSEFLFRDTLKIPIPPFFTQVVGLILTLFSWTYVKDVIEDAIESELKIKKKDIEEEYEKKSPEAIREKQEQEFLAIWLDKDKYMDQVNFNKMSTNVRQEFMKDRSEFQNVYLKDFEERYKARQEILETLLNEEEEPLLRLVRSTGDYIFNKKDNDKITDEENEIYLKIYTILRAWLLCSIKFDCVMPVESLHKIIKDSKYEIDALKHIRDTLLDDPAKGMKILPNEKSREIVKFYINELIKQMDQPTV